MDLRERLGFLGTDWAAIDRVDDWPQQRFAAENERRDDRCCNDQTARANAPIPAEPHSVAAVFSPSYLSALFHDHACPKKADPGHDIGDDSRLVLGIAQTTAEINERRRADAAERQCPQPSVPLAKLAFDANEAAQHKSCAERQYRAERGGGTPNA